MKEILQEIQNKLKNLQKPTDIEKNLLEAIKLRIYMIENKRFNLVPYDDKSVNIQDYASTIFFDNDKLVGTKLVQNIYDSFGFSHYNITDNILNNYSYVASTYFNNLDMKDISADLSCDIGCLLYERSNYQEAKEWFEHSRKKGNNKANFYCALLCHDVDLWWKSNLGIPELIKRRVTACNDYYPNGMSDINLLNDSEKQFFSERLTELAHWFNLEKISVNKELNNKWFWEEKQDLKEQVAQYFSLNKSCLEWAEQLTSALKPENTNTPLIPGK